MGEIESRPESVAIGSWTWGATDRALRRGDDALTLTRLERDLLAYLAARPGQTVAREELLQRVWGYSPRARTRAVVNTVARLRAKLGDDGAAIVNVYGQGYRLDPIERPSLVGRERELAAVLGALAAHGQVTVHGMGGVGKTCLARAVAERRPEAVWVDVAAAADGEELRATVVEALDVHADGPDAVELALRSRDADLLVLDEAERVGAELLDVVAAWRAAVPGLQVLVTSRYVWRDEPAVTLPTLDAGAAEALFRRRAAAACPDAALDDDDVRRVVGALEGLPLAIELAAARLRVLDVGGLADRLAAARAVLSDRGRSVQAALDTSWALLADDEREVLCAAAQLPGTFPVEALEEVVGRDVLDPLDGLVRASLVARAGRRLLLLELVRRFVDAHTPDTVRERFVRFAVARAEGLWRASVAARPAAADALLADTELLRAGLARAHRPVDRAHLALALALRDVIAGPRHRTRPVLDELSGQPLPDELAVEIALARLDQDFAAREPSTSGTAERLRARAGLHPDQAARAGLVAVAERRIRDGGGAVDEARALVDALDAPEVPARYLSLALRELALTRLGAGDLDQALDDALRSVALADPADQDAWSFVVRTLAHVYHTLGRDDDSVPLLTSAYEAVGGPDGGVPALRIGAALGATLVDLGRAEPARRHLAEVARAAGDLGDVAQLLYARTNLANVEPDPAVAERHYVEVRELAVRASRDELAPICDINIGHRRHLLGRLAAARDAYERAADGLAERDHLNWVTARTWSALAAAEAGEPDVARGILAGLGDTDGLAAALIGLVRATLDRDEAAWRALTDGPPLPSPFDETVALCARHRDDAGAAGPR